MQRVLLAEDKKLNQIVAAGTLRKLGYEIEIVDGGTAAVEICRHERFDAVLMDVMMPDMDGYETMRQIRRAEAFRKLPIIAITAKAMKGDREKCIAAGATEYISKPVDTDQLVSMMRVWLGRV